MNPGTASPGGLTPGSLFPGSMIPGGSMMPGAPTGGMIPMGQTGAIIPPQGTPGGGAFQPIPREESYVENILRMNLGKVGTFYMTYENNSEWNAKIFKGVIEAAGRDHIIISDPVTGKRFLLLMLNLDYITFDEPLNYNLPFGSGGTRAR
nr:spore coat protein GerQ [Cohnella xylanilytica]